MAQAGKGRLNYRCPSCFMRDLDIDMFYDKEKNEYYCMAETLVSLGVDVELADNDECNAIKYALDKYDSKMRKILTVNR